MILEEFVSEGCADMWIYITAMINHFEERHDSVGGAWDLTALLHVVQDMRTTAPKSFLTTHANSKQAPFPTNFHDTGLWSAVKHMSSIVVET